MSSKRLVVVGASAGGIEALRTIAAALPADFPAPICVVLHTAPESPGVLADILNRVGALKASNARDGERLHAGHIYVAPPDYHMLVEPGVVRLTKGPRENRFRPAIDPLFRSAAQVHGPGATGVILSGSLDDGVDGLSAIKKLGGSAIVQDPADAMYSDLPRNAIDHVSVDHIIPVAEIAPTLVSLTAPPVEARAQPIPEQLAIEVRIAMEEDPIEAGLENLGEPSQFSCPECHGVLLELKEGTRTKYRCHTGHAFSVHGLLAAVGEVIEESLWTSIRALEEARLLMTRMAEHMRATHGGDHVDELLDRADQARRQADVIRDLVTEREPLPSSSNP